jgi:glutamine amidotransferase
MIGIIDYGMGNLLSVWKAFEKLGFHARIVKDPKDIQKAEKIVLPGVGSFGDCMNNLIRLRLLDPIVNHIKSEKPYLGICLGLQILFSQSEEFGNHRGLDIIAGRVVRFPGNLGIKVPHMGWNQIKIVKKSPLLDRINEGTYFYFVHSYFVSPDDETVISTRTDYGITFVSGIWKENIYAFQFHPEKSQKAGLDILKAFGDL